MEKSTPCLKRSRSMCSMYSGNVSNFDKDISAISHRSSRSRTVSDSSVEIYVINDSDSERLADAADSGLGASFDVNTLARFEQKIDRLGEIFSEQCSLLSRLREELRHSKAIVEDAELSQFGSLRDIANAVGCSTPSEDSTGAEGNARGRQLLDAIEYRADHEQDLRDILADFLQSEETRSHITAATAARVRGEVGARVSRELAARYLPALRRDHRALARALLAALHAAFLDMEEKSASLTKSVCRATKSLRVAIERHQAALEAAPRNDLLAVCKTTVEEALQQELRQWRQDAASLLPSAPEPRPETPERAPFRLEPDPEGDGNVVDRLMLGAVISKHLSEGDACGAVERALHSGELRVVWAACRAAGAHALFAPPPPPRVLLALAQQLSTDVGGDTMLKCRFLEETIISLDRTDPGTRQHLPLVVGEIRKHLTRFLMANPSHEANRRISLIVMAAESLLK